MKDMFLNCTYVNIISFSDHVVTFKFEGISILRLTGIFSGNFIIFWDFMWTDQNRSVLPVSNNSVGVQLHLEMLSRLPRKRLETNQMSSHIESVETGKTDLFWSVYEKYEKQKISEKSGSMKNENVFIEPEGHP